MISRDLVKVKHPKKLFSNDHDEKPSTDYWATSHEGIKIIDFGGATFADDYHSDIINTRQYRAPEVILGCCVWNEISDVWSIGCIIFELLSGDLLFPTHENYEHLAMIEKMCGPIPKHMAFATEEEKLKKCFTTFDDGT